MTPLILPTPSVLKMPLQFQVFAACICTDKIVNSQGAGQMVQVQEVQDKSLKMEHIAIYNWSQGGVRLFWARGQHNFRAARPSTRLLCSKLNIRSH